MLLDCAAGLVFPETNPFWAEARNLREAQGRLSLNTSGTGSMRIDSVCMSRTWKGQGSSLGPSFLYQLLLFPLRYIHTCRGSVPVKPDLVGLTAAVASVCVCVFFVCASSASARSFWDLLESLIFQSSSYQFVAHWHSRSEDEIARKLPRGSFFKNVFISLVNLRFPHVCSEGVMRADSDSIWVLVPASSHDGRARSTKRSDVRFIFEILKRFCCSSRQTAMNYEGVVKAFIIHGRDSAIVLEITKQDLADLLFLIFFFFHIIAKSVGCFFFS